MVDLNNGFGTADVSHALQIVAAWTASLQGDGDLGAAADLLMELLPADYVRIDRCMADAGPTMRIHASARAPLRGADHVSQSSPSQRGSVIVCDDGKMAILVLGTATSQQDICTIGLSHPLTYAQTALLDLVAVALARAWARRQPGLITWRIAQLARKNAPRKAPSPRAPILDYSNPYGLSRCEFRVCSLLGGGMSAKQIAETLQLSEATVRSHQKAIYAKTDLSGQIALLMHLKTNPTAQTLLQDLSLLAA